MIKAQYFSKTILLNFVVQMPKHSQQNKETYNKTDENRCNRSEEEHDLREQESEDIGKTDTQFISDRN